MKNFKILYIYPYESYGTPFLLTNFIRISNYLNSKKEDLNVLLEEEYLDLRYENLPKYIPENLISYRIKLNELLLEVYKKQNFNLVAISCYSGHSYLNAVEVAHLIKKKIKPSSIIVVGGPHATICTEDFQPKNLPDYFKKEYPPNTTPFDYLIKDEGEIPFFKLVKGIVNNTIERRKDLSFNCIILEPEIIENLEALPIIDLTLYKKYKDVINKNDKIFIEFSRGCFFKCKFCPDSSNLFIGYRCVRLKSAKKCIEELKAINRTEWLFVHQIEISDHIFLPKKSVREQFFRDLQIYFNEEGAFPFQIMVENRVETSTINDLRNFKKFNFFVEFGIESCSKKLLYRMGKVLGKNDNEINRGIDRYLNKFETIIKEANKLKLPISYFILIGLPGEDKTTIKENRDFFLKKRENEKALIENYLINLRFNKYLAIPGSELYDYGEEKFGTKILFKNWWKKFDKKQAYYSMIVNPSKELNFLESMALNFQFFSEIIKAQNKIKNPFYSLFRIMLFKKQNLINYDLYKKLLIKK